MIGWLARLRSTWKESRWYRKAEPFLRLVSSHTAERLTVRVEQQQLDARNAAEFKVALQELSPEQFSTLVLDLSEVRFVDSTGMGAIVACSKKLQEPGRLLLLKPQPAVRELLRLTRLDRFFEVLDHEDA